MSKVHYDHWKVIEEKSGRGTHWQVLGYPKFVTLGNTELDTSRILASGKDVRQSAVIAATSFSEAVHPIHPIKHVRVQMNNAGVTVEPGAMHFTRGTITMTTGGGGGGVGGFLSRVAGAIATGETIVKPKFTGTGDIFLEPRVDNVFLVQLENNKLICDRGMFVACDSSVEVGAHFLGAIAASQGGEGVALPSLTGTGVVMLSSPVSLSRIMKVDLDNEELRVDGSFGMVAIGNITLTVEKSSKSIVSSATSGEGLVNVYRGTGQVWLNLQEGRCFV